MKFLFPIPHIRSSLLRRFSVSLNSLLSSPKPSHQTQVLPAQFLKNFAKNDSFPYNTSQFTHITANLCRHVGPTKVLDFLRAFKEHGGVFEDARVFNLILSGFARESDYNKMNKLLSEMREMGAKPDVFTYGIIINFLCKSRQVDDALKVLDEMLKSDSEVKPDTVTFNMVIDGLCKVFRVQEGLLLLQKMNNLQGFNCKPDTITYNTLIDGFCKTGDIETGINLVNKMDESKVFPSIITLNLIINGLCRNEKLGTALDFFTKKKIEWSQIKPDNFTYSTLIGAFLHSNNISKSMYLYEEMIKNGLKPDLITYFTLISGLTQAGLVNKAFNIASTMKQEGYKLDLKSCNILINGFCSKKRLDKAREVLDEMTELGLQPDLFTYNTLLSTFCKIKDFSSVSVILQKMKDAKIKPSVVTYGTLINGYCKVGKLPEALNIFKTLKNPNTVIYNILIDALCRNEDVKMGVLLLEEMRERAISANVTTYNAVLRGVREEGMIDKGFEIMDWMVKERCKPNFVTIDLLLNWSPQIGKEKFRKFVGAFRD